LPADYGELLGETLSAPWMAGPVVGNRPPLARFPIPPAIRHCGELCCGAGLLTRRAELAG
jgi:hypothetical protein